MIYKAQLPCVFLVNFVFAGELDAVMEEIHDLAPVHDIVSALGEERLAGDDGLAADGSGAGGGARLCALELVVVGSEVEGRGLQPRGHRGLRRRWARRRRRGSAVAHRRVPKRDRKLELEFEFPPFLSISPPPPPLPLSSSPSHSSIPL